MVEVPSSPAPPGDATRDDAETKLADSFKFTAQLFLQLVCSLTESLSHACGSRERGEDEGARAFDMIEQRRGPLPLRRRPTTAGRGSCTEGRGKREAARKERLGDRKGPRGECEGCEVGGRVGGGEVRRTESTEERGMLMYTRRD